VARSHAEFTAKIGAALEEADEAVFWLDHLRRAELASAASIDAFYQESLEMAAILGAAKRTCTRNASLGRVNPTRQVR
jgi:four helix bundle protein